MSRKEQPLKYTKRHSLQDTRNKRIHVTLAQETPQTEGDNGNT